MGYNENASRFIWRVTFSPDGKMLAAGSSDGTITLWDSGSGDLLRAIPAHTRAVTALDQPGWNWLAPEPGCKGALGVEIEEFTVEAQNQSNSSTVLHPCRHR
jgi:WD40 repeat protein